MTKTNLTEDLNDDFSPSIKSLKNLYSLMQHINIYFKALPLKAVCFQQPDRLFITGCAGGCPTAWAGASPMAALREGEAAGPAPHLNHPDQAHQGLQLDSNMSPGHVLFWTGHGAVP